MIDTLLVHLGMAAAGVTVVLALALALRAVVRDVVARYAIVVAAIPMTLLVLPVQIASSEVDTPAQQTVTIEASSTAPAAAPTDDPAHTSIGAHDSSAAPSPPRVSFDTRWLLVAYALGALATLAIAVLRLGKALRVLRRATPIDDVGTLAIWDELAPLRRGHRVRLLECPGLPSPACWGFGRPAVILPGSVELGADAMRCVLHHELVHIRHRDPLVVIGQLLVRCLFWMHPLVWYFDRVIERDRELACDARVVRETRRARTYAMTLLTFCRRETASPLPSFGSLVPLKRRLEMLEHATTNTTRRPRLLAAGCIAALIGVNVVHAAVIREIGPDPLLQRAATTIDGMRAEMRATTHGRGDAATWFRWQEVAAHIPELAGHYQGDGSITEQETVVAAYDARLDPESMTIEAKEILLNMPEGSALRAEFIGEEVIVQPTEDGTLIMIRGGEVRISDSDGVNRMVATGAGGSQLLLEARMDNGEVAFVARGSDGGGVRVHLDITTGIPEEEEQPPHGSVRWDLQWSEDVQEPSRLKMQWIYDVKTVRSAGEKDEG